MLAAAAEPEGIRQFRRVVAVALPGPSLPAHQRRVLFDADIHVFVSSSVRTDPQPVGYAGGW